MVAEKIFSKKLSNASLRKHRFSVMIESVRGGVAAFEHLKNTKTLK